MFKIERAEGYREFRLAGELDLAGQNAFAEALSEEIGRMLHEMQLGVKRSDAMRNLSDRTNVPGTPSVTDRRAWARGQAKLTTEDLTSMNAEAATGTNLSDIAKKWLAGAGISSS